MSGLAHLRVYGLSIAVSGWPEAVAGVRLDYAWFAGADGAAPAVEVEIEAGAADFERFGPLTASFVTPRFAVYRTPTETIVDHSGRAVSVIDRGGDRLRLRGDDEQTVHDAAYYFLLGRIGAHLDEAGFVRLHSLGVAGERGAVAVLMPPGGGKTTLALQALEDERVQLLSEDSPLLDRQGRLHPFPLRLGVVHGEGRTVEPGWVQRKAAVEVESFADRVAAQPAPLRHLVVGRRSLGVESALLPKPRRAVARSLLREGVAGVGLYQGLGYAHQRGGRELTGKLLVAGRRAGICFSALARAQVSELVLSRDSERNWAALSRLLH